MKQQLAITRSRLVRRWALALLLSAVGFALFAPSAGAQWLTNYYLPQPQLQYVQSIHNGVIANLGPIMFDDGHVPALDGKNMRWVVYRDNLEVVALGGAGEWCTDCEVFSGREACEILNARADYSLHETALGHQLPVLQGGEELCTSTRSGCSFCANDTPVSTYLTQDLSSATSCDEVTRKILVSWPRPSKLVKALVSASAGGCETPPFRSALIKSNGDIVARTSEAEGTIAPLQGYIWPKQGVDEKLRCAGAFDGAHFSKLDDQARYFTMCNSSRIASYHTIFNPQSATIDLVSLAESTVRGVPTDRWGAFSVAASGILHVPYVLSASMSFTPFSPRTGAVRTYWLRSDSGEFGFNGNTNIPLNLTLVTGKFYLETRPGQTVTTVTGGDASPWAHGMWPDGLTRYEMKSNGTSPEAQDELVKISQADLRDTSIYVFRQSDGELLGSRWGLSNLELGCYGKTQQIEAPVCNPTFGGAAYQLLIRGYGANVGYTTQSGKEAGQSALGVELTYNKQAARAEQGLRIGEPARLVFLNHATGYMATMPFTTGVSDSASSAQKRVVALRPPNLRIWAERVSASSNDTYRVGSEGAGLTNDIRIQIYTEWLDQNGAPLPEGLALTGRLAVSNALGSGQPNDPKVLTPVGDEVAFAVDADAGQGTSGWSSTEAPLGSGKFAIRPGFHSVLLRMPSSEAQNAAHFYVHVDGANPEFQGQAIDNKVQPNSADFSVDETCYVHNGDGGVPLCIQRSNVPDAGVEEPGESEAMLERPWTHVPVLVPVYRKETNTTDWIRRPEYHFSLLDLEKLTVTRQTSTQGPVVVVSSPTGSSEGKELLSTDTRLDIVWTLNANEQDELERFSGVRSLSWQLTQDQDAPTRTLVATADSTGRAHINDPGQMVASDVLALRLVQDGDEANVLWQYKFRSIDFHLEDRKTSVQVGKTAKVIAETKPADMNVTWRIVKQSKGVLAKVKSLDALTAALQVAKDSGEGKLLLEATGTEAGQAPIKISKLITVGCECKQCASTGNLECEQGEVSAKWQVGAANDGQNAGTISLEGDEVGAELGKPTALSFSSFAEGVEVVRQDAAIRQIKAPDTLVDVVTTSPSSYELRFYPPSAAGARGTNGVYAVSGGAAPNARWVVSAGAKLTIQGNQDGKSKYFEYSHDTSSNAWTLGKGETDVQQRESVTIQMSGTDRIERSQTSDAGGGVGTDVVRTYRDFEPGAETPMERMVMEVVDPDGANLTTLYSYITSKSDKNYLQVRRIDRSDGSWVEYEYDDEGRVITETTPWLDGSSTRVVSTSYTPVDSRELNGGSFSSPWGALTLVTLNAVSPVAIASSTAATSDVDNWSPRMVIERVAGVEVSRTYYAQLTVAATPRSARLDVSERAGYAGAPYGDPANQRTVTLFHARSGLRDELYVRGVAYPDGRVDTIDSQLFGTAANPTGRRETVTHGSSTQPNGVSGKSTREVRTEDARGNVVREELFVHTGSGFELGTTTTNTYDTQGRVTRSVRSNGTETSASYGCCGYDTQTDEQGITTTYTYDGLGRVLTDERLGITTTHVYDAAGREVETRRQSSSGTLTSKRSYDLAGRLRTSTDEAGLVTGYSYSSDGRTTTVTRPGGATEVTNAYADGRTASVTGTGVVAQYMSYLRNSDGGETTETRVGGATSPQVERSVADFLGRNVRTERPGFGGTTESSQSFYNTQGQLVRQTNSGAPDTLFAYDALGNQTRSAQDIDGDGAIGLSSADRVQESESLYVQRNGGIWQETTQRVYAAEETGTPTTVSTQRSRLSGFSGGAISEAESVDIYGNLTSNRTLLNASGATLTQMVNLPDSAIDQITISVQGRLISTTSSTGLTTAFLYDGFGRRTTVMDGRTGASTTHYDGVGRVDYVEDAAQHRTSFAYELSTGRKIGEINALGKVTRFAYTLRGELWRTWGDVPYPVEYGYDAQGRRTTMRTYRQALAWNDTSWPMAATGDLTTWEYEPASGLLSAKRDAAGQAVQYTYAAGGRLKTRRWARTQSGSALVTTYNYRPETGELAQVDYSDATPDVTFAYDRVGRTKQVTDGTGTHTLAYDPASLALTSETRAGLVPATLTYKHESSGVKGRSTGVQLGGGYDVTYGYDAQGRMGSVSWNVSGATNSVTYARVPSSELLRSVTYASGLVTTYGYEATRDLKTQVKNAAGGATVSQYDYQYDAVGRRSSVVNTGTAFAQSAYSKWNYNDRNELIESARYQGTNVGDISRPVTDEYRAYGFDPIGNRTGATEAETTKSYATNALNEYTSADGATLTYDVDGNLTNDGTRKFTYDGENRLVFVEPVTAGAGKKRVRMAYDYLGRRAQKVVEEHDGAGWAAADDVRFVYLGWNVVEERKTSSGVNTKKNFAWGMDLSQSMSGAGGIGGLLAVVDETGTQMAFVFDANGNVGQLVDEGGSAVARYEYDAFGNQLVASGSAANDNGYRFSTKFTDAETRLVYYGKRFYDPTAGRWLNRDPAGEGGGLNLYAAMRNNALRFVDPDGNRFVRADGSIEYLRPNGLTWVCTGGDCFHHDAMVTDEWFSQGAADTFRQTGRGIAALRHLSGSQIAGLLAILTNPITLCIATFEGIEDLIDTAKKALFSDDFYERAYYAGRLAAQAQMAVAGSVAAKVFTAAGMGTEPVVAEVAQLRDVARSAGARAAGADPVAGEIPNLLRDIDPLDWSIVSKSGETRVTHVAKHGANNLQKESHGVFYGDPATVAEDAWSIAQRNGLEPVTINNTDVYVVSRPNSGYAGGFAGQGKNLNSVTVITQVGTNKLITAFPGNGLPVPKP